MPDHPRFCTSCGASLEPGQKFCTSCGSPVQRDAVNVSQSGPDSTAPMPLVGAPEQQSGAADVTQALPVSDIKARQYLQPSAPKKAPSAGSGGPNKKILIAVIAVLAVVVCILVGVLVGAMSGNGSQTQSGAASEASSSSDSAPSASSSDHASKGGESAASSSDEKELYSTLSGYYERLGSYDSAISDAAKSFNANYMSKSSSSRSSYADSASSLQEDIANDYSSLKSLSVPSGSRYSSCYSAMLTCYYDCTQRIGVIVEAWGNSLRYSDPTGHSDEICAPLSRDKSGNSNKYYTEFNQTYPSAKPPSA